MQSAAIWLDISARIEKNWMIPTIFFPHADTFTMRYAGVIIQKKMPTKPHKLNTSIAIRRKCFVLYAKRFAITLFPYSQSTKNTTASNPLSSLIQLTRNNLKTSLSALNCWKRELKKLTGQNCPLSKCIHTSGSCTLQKKVWYETVNILNIEDTEILHKILWISFRCWVFHLSTTRAWKLQTLHCNHLSHRLFII